MEDLKIVLAYHKPDYVIHNDIYIPVHAGRALVNKTAKGKEKILKNFISDTVGDDTGENISLRNKSLNELTAIYWAWKNYASIGNPKFIGVGHYRRQFIFNEYLLLPNRTWLPRSSVYCFKNIEEAAPFINTEYAIKLLSKNNVLCTKKYNANNLNNGRVYKSCKERFIDIKPFNANLYDLLENIILDKEPSYYHEIQELRERPEHYLFNMFVFPKDLFYEYCEFMFPVIIQIDEANKLHNEKRAPGFLGEFVTSMFISHKIRCDRIKHRELNTTFIFDTRYQRERCNSVIKKIINMLK